MKDDKIDAFLEKANMNYLFCLLSKLEGQRISNFPAYVKQKFDKKLSVVAMEHVADNEVPDYLDELAEAERLMAAKLAASEEDDDGIEFTEETIDDSARYTHEIEEEVPNPFESVEERDPFSNVEDDDEDFEDDDDFDDDDE